jgi:hypothetical protein
MKLYLQNVGLESARVMVGMNGHRPSGKASCIGGKMKAKKYSKPDVGMGGRNNKALQKDFVQAGIDCGFKVSDATRRKFGL